MVEQMRRQARAAERRRSLIIVAICVVVAVVIVGVAGWSIYQDRQATEALKKKNLEDIGAAAEAADCGSIQEESAEGQGEHTTAPVDYATVPPSFGPHNEVPTDAGIHFYDEGSRPEVERLVHNLEHGWTIVWYDDTVADDSEQMRVLEATADKFDAQGQDPAFNMIIAPWTEDDGDGRPIPDGKHIALSHWSIHQPVFDPEKFKPSPSFGQSQYCATFSGGVLEAFMEKYPYDDAPEGAIWHQNG